MKELIKSKNYAFKQSMKDIIPPINYLTHNIYSYPAKFIPHVPQYVISKFLKQDNRVVMDPFAGSSSTAIEALCFGHNCICIDINPLTDFLTKVKTQRITFQLTYSSMKLDTFLRTKNEKLIDNKGKAICLKKVIEEMRKCDEYFSPKWKNIDHWYPVEFKHILAKMWGYIYSVENIYPADFMNLLKLTALYVSRYLSYGARDVPKLFRSKRRIKQVEKLRTKVKNNPIIPFEVFQKKLLEYSNQMNWLLRILEERRITPEYEYKLSTEKIRSDDPYKRKITCLGGTDISTFEFPIDNEFIDLIVTSPPYIYAQEYIRSTKLDLYWLNLVDDARVRNLTKQELGIKTDVEIEVINNKLRHIDSFNKTAEALYQREQKKYGKSEKYTQQTFNYFYDMYRIIEKIYRYLNEGGVFGLFIGNPTVLGSQVPCHTIFSEFFSEIGLDILELGYDEIVSPRLLKGRQNLSPDGMKAEWLLIAQK